MIKRSLRFCFSAVRTLFRRIGYRFARLNRSNFKAYHHRSTANDYSQTKETESPPKSHDQGDHIVFSIPRDEVVRALNQTLWRTANIGPRVQPDIEDPDIEDSEYADHPDFIQSLADSAYICDCQGRYAEAERLYLQVLSLSQRHYGEGHTETAAGLSDLAAFYCEQQRYNEAEPILTELLEVRSQSPSQPSAVADALFRLGELYQQQQQSLQAQAYLQQAVSILLETFGPEDSRTRAAQRSLSQVHTDEA